MLFTFATVFCVFVLQKGDFFGQIHGYTLQNDHFYLCIRFFKSCRVEYHFDTGSLAGIGIDNHTILVLVGWYFGQYFEH
jgi:hypothetical protein